MSESNVCRLCLADADTMDVFDRRIAVQVSLEVMILEATGVEIKETDHVSKRICPKCLEIVTRVYKYRHNCQKNNKTLQSEPPPPEPAVVIKTEIDIESSPLEDETENIAVTTEEQQGYSIKIHPSIQQLYEVYPILKLPAMCLDVDIDPIVEVELTDYDKLMELRTNCSNSIEESTDVNGIDEPILNVSERQSSLSNLTPDNNLPKTDATSALEPQQDKQPPKRKNSDTGPSVNKKIKLAEPSSLDTSVSYVEKSVRILECEICNGVFSTPKDLRSHQRSHMRCQFCKKSFKSLFNKKRHVDSDCMIYKMMTNLPHVSLPDILRDRNVRKKYSNAFVNFEPLSDEITKALDKNDKDLSVVVVSDEENTVETDSNRILNEETGMFTKDPDKVSDTGTPATKTNVSPQVNSMSSKEECDIPQSDIPATNNELPAIPATQVTTTDNGDDFNFKPNIKLKHDFLSPIDHKSSSIKIIKDLLIKQKLYNLTSEKGTDPMVPKLDDVSYNKDSRTFELNNIKSQLNIYKVPVEIRNGPFDVSFVYPQQKVTKKKKLNLWVEEAIDLVYPQNLQAKTAQTVPASALATKTNTLCIPATSAQAQNNLTLQYSHALIQSQNHKTPQTVPASAVATKTNTLCISTTSAQVQNNLTHQYSQALMQSQNHKTVANPLKQHRIIVQTKNGKSFINTSQPTRSYEQTQNNKPVLNTSLQPRISIQIQNNKAVLNTSQQPRITLTNTYQQPRTSVQTQNNITFLNTSQQSRVSVATQNNKVLNYVMPASSFPVLKAVSANGPVVTTATINNSSWNPTQLAKSPNQKLVILPKSAKVNQKQTVSQSNVICVNPTPATVPATISQPTSVAPAAPAPATTTTKVLRVRNLADLMA
ncbi:uncharacterized protein LOC109604660 [Aethina tumida]|uniref:uncharacterized protein LOC109604660 n=1 Tax=Aethina tumida TaxID=116153 RepID=UPI00214842C9|nr:uncharacterized protein LOC109604660 [Aethina tumida]